MDGQGMNRGHLNLKTEATMRILKYWGLEESARPDSKTGEKGQDPTRTENCCGSRVSVWLWFKVKISNENKVVN